MSGMVRELFDFLLGAGEAPAPVAGLEGEMFESLIKGKSAEPLIPDSEPVGVSAKQLRWKMNSSGIELMLITPALAKVMLEYNDKNRPLSLRTVEKYARQMKAGEWRLTRQPIIFSASSRLRDGQHRLHACETSGISFKAYVAFGDDDANFAFIDIGKPRGPADIFAINGVKNYAAMASATRWVMGYDNNNLSAGATGLSITATPAELYEVFLQHPRLCDSAKVFDWFAESGLAAPSMMMALHYICARKNRALADAFFKCVGTSLGLTDRSSPQYKLNKRLIENRGAASAKLKGITIAAYTLKAWNAVRADKPLGIFRWRGEQKPDEAFPKAI